MLEHETEQQTRMRDIIVIYAQESGDDGWVVSTLELKNAYNEGLPKKERIDTVTAFKLAFDLQEDLKHHCYVKHEYSMQLDGSYVHCFGLMAHHEIEREERESAEDCRTAPPQGGQNLYSFRH